MQDVDKLLWRIVINDDKEAYRTLFELFYSALCLFANRYVEERIIAEDLVQDVFVNIWENRKKINVESSAKNYLFVCVKNHCINHIKQEMCRQNHMDVYKTKMEVEHDYEEFYLHTELKSLLDEALAKLPETYRLIFEMSRLEGNTNKEIAEKLNIPLRTVERYKVKVIEVLKKDLKDYLPLLLYFHLFS